MKAGIGTTEFWMALGVALAGALAVVYVDAEWAKVAGMIAAALASAGYGFSRSRTKGAEAEAGASIVREQEYTRQAELQSAAKKKEQV